MDMLSSKFLDSCRRDKGRVLRGENMTRIETFVDAAFAFAFTMLVISIDNIPDTTNELLALSQDIPAFILSCAVVGSIWVAHSTWSRTFGLQDGVTIVLSLALVVLVLIFVYPIKLMIQVSVMYLSNGRIGMQPSENMEWTDAANLFAYFGLGLISLSVILIAFYQNALRYKVELGLNEIELYFCRRSSFVWLVVAMTAALSCILAKFFLTEENISTAGLLYNSLVLTIPAVNYIGAKYSNSPAF
ncbi:MAG: DUF1211 domain-containing protein [SAR86 cluster bacterium]|uniref:DUF1211 domain-containing protein n=1 Tax=SAR86 cluster bacterium TaxID=2030880 RepID=A0A2A5B763_9GAMM|nr:MAG: DUF1211 domain-containing protein [SAR86 cluster bacterium]